MSMTKALIILSDYPTILRTHLGTVRVGEVGTGKWTQEISPAQSV